MSRWSLPERRAAGSTERRSGGRKPLGGIALAALLLPTAFIDSAPAREWRTLGIAFGESESESGSMTIDAEPSAVPGTVPDAQEVTGVDIRIADLLAGGSELAGVAPRPATSGIGSDVERDLFSDAVPLNAPASPQPENDPESPY